MSFKGNSSLTDESTMLKLYTVAVIQPVFDYPASRTYSGLMVRHVGV